MKNYFIAALATLVCFLSAPLRAAIEPLWSTGVAVPGEKVVLYLIDMESQAEDPIAIKEQPQVARASVRLLQPRSGSNPLDPKRGIVAMAPIQVIPDAPGTLELGSIEVSYSSGKTVKVDVPPLPVVSTADITWYDTPYPYGALWHVDTKDGYVNQPVNANLKLFIPQGDEIPHLPSLKPMGVSVAYFQPALQGLVAMVHGQNIPTPIAYARGETWRTADFIGEFSPFREGQQGVAASVFLTHPQRSELSRPGFRAVTVQQVNHQVELPTLTLSALPLPPGAPADFANTVGQYSISATTEAKSLAMHEAVEVEITVRGTGNLTNFECPKPVDAADWKLVPATRKPILDGNGQTVGMVFSQLMRPTAEVGGIPAFSFSYFDPQTMEYRRAETRPIPLTWRMTAEAGSGLQAVSATAPPPAGEVPVEEMRDIYGFLTQGGSSLSLPRWLWYLLYLPALIILFVLGLARLRRLLAAGAEGRARERELSRLARQTSGLEFLKALGGFIESNIPPTEQTPELRDILARRDEEAFRPEASVSISPAEKNTMLRQVRRALAKVATTAALLLLALAPSTWAQGTDVLAEAERAYNAAQYSEARAFLQSKAATPGQEAALINYNMGNCFYRLNQPGQAALCYARALWADPGMKEARLNLAFVQRQQGAILPVHEGANAVFTFFTPQQLWVGTVVATALLALCLALQLACRHLPRPWLHTVTAFALLLSFACTANWVYYLTRETPDFALLPPQNLAYVVTEDVARSAADEKGAEVIRLTPSTPVRLLATRGSRSYVETAMGTRGWVQTASIAPLCPEGATPRMPLTLHF